MSRNYDRIIIGAGLYGLYSAVESAKRGYSVLLLERENAPFSRATYINQARVHMGYHYPRSISTALKSRNYFERFVKDFEFCIADEFKKIYATSSKFSWTNRERFIKFCDDADIPCEEISPDAYFKKGMCDGAFITTEYAYDWLILRDFYSEKIKEYRNIDVKLNTAVCAIEKQADRYSIITSDGGEFESPFVISAVYASCNEILELAGYPAFKIKYELCEMIICEPSDNLKNLGITVMDGPFFSIMPFGKTGLHSLTSVTFTPHLTSYDVLPTFNCQKDSGGLCNKTSLYNCNICPGKPETAYPYMGKLARKYLRDKYDFRYKESLYSMKPIMSTSEVDDSRPTVIRKFSENPTFISVLSGKINTVYDLDEVLSE
ncbi:MAG: FAD-dependent oxidoreductase [Ruminococcaceae bacterium]|nr:FAD-dependent oxidoreductase [Oscillospiraceae bacterium]